MEEKMRRRTDARVSGNEMGTMSGLDTERERERERVRSRRIHTHHAY